MSKVTSAGAVVLAVLSLITFKSVGTRAQSTGDEIYVTTLNPTTLHGFHFDSASHTFVEDDLDPATSNLALHVGVDSGTLAVTDRFFLMGNAITNVALSIVDPLTGVELPRPPTSVTTAAAIAASADGQYAFAAGAGPGGSVPPVVSVFDLRPSSPTMGRELTNVQLPVAPGITTSANQVAAADGSHRLFVAETEHIPSGNRTFIDTIDVSDPAHPVVTATREATPNRFVASLHVFTIAGTEYLFVARGRFEIYRVELDGSLTLVQTILSTNPSGAARQFVDVTFLSEPAGDRAIGVTQTFASDNSTVIGEELLAIDMSPTAGSFNGSILASTSFGVLPSTGVATAALSSDGATLFAMDQGSLSTAAVPGQPGRLFAFNTADVLAGGASPLATRIIDTTSPLASGGGMALHAPLAVSTTVGVNAVGVDGSVGAVLVNDSAHTIAVKGSGLTGVQHVFVGPLDASITSATDGEIDATVPALSVPAATVPVLALGSGGSARGSVTIANSPTYVPANVVYASAFAGNVVVRINAATKTEVTSSFSTGSGPSNAVVSADGKVLFVTDFRSNQVSVHSLVDDPANGVTAGQLIANITVGDDPQAIALDPHRDRVYVASSPGLISIIGADPADPSTYLKVIDSVSTGRSDLYRSIALTPDGQTLYVGANEEPFLIAINVSTDQPSAGDITPITLGINEPAGRTDGLFVSPDGTHLYFMHQSDPGLRVYDIRNRTSPVPAPGLVPLQSAPNCPVEAADIRRIEAAPDGRFVYVSSRSRGCVDVYDTSTEAFIPTPIPTGAFSAEPAVSPDSQFVFVPVEQSDSVKTIDERATVNGAVNPTFHHVIAVTAGGQGTTSTAVSPGIATDAGAGVSISPLPDATVTFDDVTAGGNTTMTSGNTSALTLPPHFEIQGVPVFFDIRTTATFTGNVTVCVPYDPDGLTAQDQASLRLLHEDNGTLVDVTTNVDTVNHQVCGVVTHFSQFAVAEFVNHAPIANAGPNRTVAVGPTCTAPVTLDGSASSDPDGDPLTFLWSGAFGTAATPTVPVTVPLGNSTFTLTVTDPLGAASTASTTVTAKDLSAPQISSVTPVAEIGARNDGIPVSFSVSVADNCDPAASCHITAITPVDGAADHGRLSRPATWQITGPLTAVLVADGNSDHGEAYTVTMQCADASGNVATKTFAFTLSMPPHN